MIEVQHLTKEFGPNVAVSDLTFSVKPGEILGFLGPNGAGKTTTMRILAGIFPPSSGEAKVCGIDVADNSMDVRKKIGYMPEQVPLYPELTVTEYLNFVTSLWPYNQKQRANRLKNVLQQCDLTHVRGRLVGHLSRGYRQRIGLAQALIHDPDVLILDEPTVGLDPKQIREIRQLIKSFQGQKTVILSTHILPEVSMTCQRVLIIHHGKIVAQGTPESLTQQAETATQVEVHVKGGPVAEISKTLSEISGIQNVEVQGPSNGAGTRLLVSANDENIRPQIARTIVEKNWQLLEMRLKSLTLEDIFVKIVTKEELA